MRRASRYGGSTCLFAVQICYSYRHEPSFECHLAFATTHRKRPVSRRCQPQDSAAAPHTDSQLRLVVASRNPLTAETQLSQFYSHEPSVWPSPTFKPTVPKSAA